jgi:hypothetical protein
MKHEIIFDTITSALTAMAVKEEGGRERPFILCSLWRPTPPKESSVRRRFFLDGLLS